jgi:hypothetical protein
VTKIQPKPPPVENKEKPAWCLLSEEALRRGYRRKDGSPNTRAFLKLLKSLEVPIKEQTKKQRFVCPADVDAAWSRLPLVSGSSSAQTEDDLVSSLIQGRR